jgi:hypothetical protein
MQRGSRGTSFVFQPAGVFLAEPDQVLAFPLELRRGKRVNVPELNRSPRGKRRRKLGKLRSRRQRGNVDEKNITGTTRSVTRPWGLMADLYLSIYRRLDEEKRVKEGGRGLDYDDRSGPRRLDRSPSPVIARSRPVGGRRPSDSRSRSPLPVRRERSRSPLPPSRSRPSISPPPRRRYSPSPSSRRDDHRARSRTPVDTRMKSRSPPPGVTINRPPPKGRPRSVSPSRSRSRPPPPARRRPDDSRSPPRRRRSASFNSDSSFSSDDSRSPPPRGARRRSRS